LPYKKVSKLNAHTNLPMPGLVTDALGLSGKNETSKLEEQHLEPVESSSFFPNVYSGLSIKLLHSDVRVQPVWCSSITRGALDCSFLLPLCPRAALISKTTVLDWLKWIGTNTNSETCRWPTSETLWAAALRSADATIRDNLVEVLAGRLRGTKCPSSVSELLAGDWLPERIVLELD